MALPSTLVLATKNPGKIKELAALLAPLGIKVTSALELGLPDVPETGSTFEENARLKAEAVAAATKLPALADDSGLCVDALDGRPGVYSADYGGYGKLLQEMELVEAARRTAHFVCMLAYTYPGQKTVFLKGQVFGRILEMARGSGGFGFDPVFQPDGEMFTYGEMTEAQKAQTSHRRQALDKFTQYLQKHK